MAAWQFYRTTLAATLRRLRGRGRWQCWLAVTPDAAAVQGAAWPAGWQPIPQGQGDLGERMRRVLRSLPPGPGVIVGTDVPDLSPAHIAAAFRALGDHDVVVGPAVDGGYWLIGVRRRSPLAALFRSVRWSTEHALADTLANAGGLTVARLDTLADVDVSTDLPRR